MSNYIFLNKIDGRGTIDLCRIKRSTKKYFGFHDDKTMAIEDFGKLIGTKTFRTLRDPKFMKALMDINSAMTFNSNKIIIYLIAEDMSMICYVFQNNENVLEGIVPGETIAKLDEKYTPKAGWFVYQDVGAKILKDLPIDSANSKWDFCHLKDFYLYLRKAKRKEKMSQILKMLSLTDKIFIR